MELVPPYKVRLEDAKPWDVNSEIWGLSIQESFSVQNFKSFINSLWCKASTDDRVQIVGEIGSRRLSGKNLRTLHLDGFPASLSIASGSGKLTTLVHAAERTSLSMFKVSFPRTFYHHKKLKQEKKNIIELPGSYGIFFCMFLMK